jgi:hypothetical protein
MAFGQLRSLYAWAWALWVVSACTSTTVDVNPPGTSAGQDGGHATASSVCATLAPLACKAPMSLCVQNVNDGLATCSGDAAAKQALLDCLETAHYACFAGEPATTDCASALQAASCSSVPGSTADAGHSTAFDGGGSVPDGATKPADAGGTLPSGSICSDLCQDGTPLTFACTSNQGPFTIQTNVGASDCPNYATVGSPVCFATQTTFNGAVLLNTDEFDCDGTIRTSGGDPCPTAGTWALAGDKLSLDLSSLGVSATCIKM